MNSVGSFLYTNHFYPLAPFKKISVFQKQTSLPQISYLPISTYHLAAQVPSQCSDPPTPHPSVVLAVRKVTWRPLLGKALVDAAPLPPVKSKSASVPARWHRPSSGEGDYFSSKNMHFRQIFRADVAKLVKSQCTCRRSRDEIFPCMFLLIT